MDAPGEPLAMPKPVVECANLVCGSCWGGREVLGAMKIRETFVWQWWGDCKGRRSQSRALKNTSTLKKDLKFEV